LKATDKFRLDRNENLVSKAEQFIAQTYSLFTLRKLRVEGHGKQAAVKSKSNNRHKPNPTESYGEPHAWNVISGIWVKT
jgi:hypothetical protein